MHLNKIFVSYGDTALACFKHYLDMDSSSNQKPSDLLDEISKPGSEYTFIVEYMSQTAILLQKEENKSIWIANYRCENPYYPEAFYHCLLTARVKCNPNIFPMPISGSDLMKHLNRAGFGIKMLPE